MLLRILLYGFLFYLFYRIIFDLVIPVYKTTRQIKKGFKDMHSRMNEQQNQQQQASSTPKASKTVSPDDYIDFEEVK